MTTTQVVETSVNNSQIQDYVHTDDHTRPTYDLLHRKRVTAISNIWSAAEEKQILLHRTRNSGFAIFFDKLIIWAPNTNLDRKINLKRKRDTENTGFFWTKPIVSPLLLAGTVAITRGKRNYPKRGTKTNSVITGPVWPQIKP